MLVPKLSPEQIDRARTACYDHIAGTIKPDGLTPANVTAAAKSAIRPRLFVWDFGGQEEYYHTHHLLMSHGAVFVIVVRMRKNAETGRAELDRGRFVAWLDSVRAHGGRKAEAVVVGTFRDELDEAAQKEWRELVLKEVTIERLLSPQLGPDRQGERIMMVSNTHGSQQARRDMQVATRPLRPERDVPVYYIVIYDMIRRAAKGTHGAPSLWRAL